MPCSEALDNQLVKHLRQGSVSFVNFDTTPPERCLDLGCGVRLTLCFPEHIANDMHIDWIVDLGCCQGMAQLRLRAFSYSCLPHFYLHKDAGRI